MDKLASADVTQEPPAPKIGILNIKSKRGPILLPYEVMEENVLEAMKTIDLHGEGLDIIVFPEYFLTTLEPLEKISDHLGGYSVEVPNAGFNPCNRRFVASILVDLSCHARTHGLMLVVNLIEKKITTKYETGLNTTKFFNTNIVFDKRGVIVSKYRKRVLEREVSFSRGSGPGYFESESGQVFGLLIGEDLFDLQNIQFLTKHSIRNVVLTTSLEDDSFGIISKEFLGNFAREHEVNLFVANNLGASGAFMGVERANETETTFESLPANVTSTNTTKISPTSTTNYTILVNEIYSKPKTFKFDYPTKNFDNLNGECKVEIDSNFKPNFKIVNFFGEKEGGLGFESHLITRT